MGGVSRPPYEVIQINLDIEIESSKFGRAVTIAYYILRPDLY